MDSSDTSFLRLSPSPFKFSSASPHGSPASSGLVRCVLTVLLAFGLFAFLFLWAGDKFWLWLTLSVLVLCCAAFLAEPAGMRGVLLSQPGMRSTVTVLLLGIGSAALVCGVSWALLYRLCGSLWINILSHAVWAAAIFVVWPMR